MKMLSGKLMVLFLPYHSLKIFMALILTQIMLINLGYQQTGFDLQDPVAIDVCDHTDSEKGCDKKETGEKDDLISHVTKTPIINLIDKIESTRCHNFRLCFRPSGDSFTTSRILRVIRSGPKSVFI